MYKYNFYDLKVDFWCLISGLKFDNSCLNTLYLGMWHHRYQLFLEPIHCMSIPITSSLKRLVYRKFLHCNLVTSPPFLQLIIYLLYSLDQNVWWKIYFDVRLIQSKRFEKKLVLSNFDSSLYKLFLWEKSGHFSLDFLARKLE